MMKNPSKFTVLYCIGSLSGHGGTERILSSKASIFADKYDIDVHICTIGKDMMRYYNFSEKIHFHNLYKPAKGVYLPIVTNYLIKRGLYNRYRRLIKEIAPHLVIVLASGTDDFYIPSICHRLKIPVVREFHSSKGAVYSMSKLINSRILRWWYLFQKKRVFRTFNTYDFLILLTNKDQIEGNYGTNSIVIPNFVPDIVPDEIAANVSENKTIISVGSMRDSAKGFDTIVRAWSVLSKKYPDWTVEIYGDGPYKQTLQKLIDGFGLSESVRLCGSTNDIAAKYRNSAFFVFASIGEGLPMVLIEAMRYGLPCVSYDCYAGPSDIITNCEDGILVPMGCFDSLIKGIEMEINNVDIRVKHSRNARSKSMLFSEDAVVPQWLDFFAKFGYRQLL